MLDRTNLFLCLFLAALLLIVFYMPSPRQQPEPTKGDSRAEQELKRFQETIKKFVKSMGEMEQRVQKLEDNVQHIQKKQESFHVNQRKDNNIPVQQLESKPVNQAVNLDAQHRREANAANFVGEIKRDKNCFDSAEHGIDGTIEIWECHQQGRNQKFQMQDGSIKHKRWCLAVEKPEEGQAVILKDCNDNNSLQEWQYNDKLIKAGEMNFCMRNSGGSGVVTLAECNAEDTSQQWDLERA